MTRFGWLLVIVGCAVAGWCALAVPARAEHDARVTADEPQYLLSAISLAEDHDLNIRDELRLQRWAAFHEAPLPQQTRPLSGGRRISPHDPLLPVLLALPVAAASWVGAKLALAVIAGGLAASTVWLAVHRFDVPAGLAALVVLAFSIVPPLAVYGTQIYPEVPAALAVVLSAAAITGPMRRGGLALLIGGLVALPWLSVKYVPVVVALAVVAGVELARARRFRALVTAAAILILAGAAWLVFHRAVYGGWTAYAAGDHFVGGEVTVMGTDPDYGGRSVRLVGLAVDRNFGLLAWAPSYVLGAVALGGMLRRRPPGWMVVVVPLLAGWLNATFVALTMHGWWWPGRQVVVVLPLVVVAVAWFLRNATRQRWWLTVLGVLTAAGVANWLWLLAEVLAGHRQLIIDFELTAAPVYRVWRHLLPDNRALGADDVALLMIWTAVLAALAVAGAKNLRNPVKHPER